MKITKNDRKEIVVAIQSGKTTSELAGKYGVSSGRIGAVYRKEAGILSKPIKRLSETEKETIAAEIQAKKATMTELAGRYGVSIATIAYTYKSRTGDALKPQLSQRDKEEIVAALQAKKATIQELAARYRVSAGTIGRNFKKMVGKAFRPHPLSQIDKDAFIAELQSGTVTIAELTTKYGVTQGTIVRRFKQITGKSLHPQQKLSQRDRKAIVQELQSGKRPNELAGKYSISSSHIGQIYKAATGNVLRSSTLSQTDKEEIVAAIQAGKATMTALAKKYGVDQTTISGVFKRMTGSALRPHKTVEMPSRYRAWHKRERKTYDVWGIDWLHRKILIQVNGSAEWQSLSKFILMGYSVLRDKKRAPEYPEGQEIYAGDIVQFPLNFTDGRKEKIKDVVAIDPATGWFVVVSVDDGDPLCLHHDECEVIGTIQENPELLGSELQKMRKLLKKYTFA